MKKSDFMTKQLPEDLIKFLNPQQLNLLSGYLSNCTFQELSNRLGLNVRQRAATIDALIDLGRVLVLYRILECEIIPTGASKTSAMNPQYLQGFIDCKKTIRRLIHYEARRWKTIKARNR